MGPFDWTGLARPGQKGGRPTFLDTIPAGYPLSSAFGTVISPPKPTGRASSKGLPPTTYAVDVLTYDGALHRRVPYATSYAQGPFGEHVGVEVGTACIVEYVGRGRQPIITRFWLPRTPDGSFGGGGGERPAIGGGDWMWIVPGQGGFKGSAYRYIARSGHIWDRASRGCRRVMDPTGNIIEDRCREHRIETLGGSQVWTSQPDARQDVLFRRIVFERTARSPLGRGGFVDTQEGAVAVKAPGGAIVDVADTRLYCKDVNGKARLEVDEEGDISLVLHGVVDLDATRSGDLPARAVGEQADPLPESIQGKTLTLSINGEFTDTFTFFTDTTLLSAVAAEINQNSSEVVAKTELSGSDLVLVIETKRTGSPASLILTGTAVAALKLPTTASGSEGQPATSQDFRFKLKGELSLSIGEKKDSRRKFEGTIAKDGVATFDVEGDGADDSVVAVLDGKNGTASIDAGKGKAKLTLKSDGTAELDAESYTLKASKTSRLEVPDLEIGNQSLTDRVASVEKLLVKLNDRFVTEVTPHTHPDPVSGVTGPSAQFAQVATPLVAADIQTNVKVDP